MQHKGSLCVPAGAVRVCVCLCVYVTGLPKLLHVKDAPKIERASECRAPFWEKNCPVPAESAPEEGRRQLKEESLF